MQERADIALADLHNLAGWACFDIGLINQACVHFSKALVLAGRAQADCLIASVFYRLGRVRLHHGDPAGALEYFHAGQPARVRAASGRPASWR